MNEILYTKLIEVASSGNVTHYSDIAPLVGLDMAKPEDRNSISILLDEISVEEHNSSRPLLSAVVIHRQDNMPGNGFFEMARRVGQFQGGDRFMFFIEELRRVHDQWSNK